MINSKANGVPLLTWGANGLPHSTLFDDQYFCKENGLEETFHVSCQGNHLQQRFAALDGKNPGTFIIVETGFGTGLNFCCAWHLWRQFAPASWQLRFYSLEKYPMANHDLKRALDLWEPLNKYKDLLVDQYQPLPQGVGEYSFDEGRVTLAIVFDDVLKALAMIRQLIYPHTADALFFDGFAPAKNPQMWAPEVFLGAAALSGGQTTFATFTVAGWVRRSLQAAGFLIRKDKGYGTKKHILVGQFKAKP